jgi:hypothetical protein
MRGLIKNVMAATAVALLAVAPAMAQKATGGIQGTVSDDTGLALPGVTVTISSPAMMGERVAVTDSDGKFRFALLPPGTYTARFTLAAFQAVELTEVRVGIENVVTLAVTMNAAFTEEVLVSGGTPLVDVTATTTGTTFNQELMQSLPTGRTFQELAFLATGAVDGGGLADPAQIGTTPSIMGSAANENRYVVDTLETTDTAYGLAGTTIPVSFLQEVQVKTGGYEAEFGGSVGGVINMITRNGGNDFTGEVFGFFTNGDLWSTAKRPMGRGDTRVVDQEWDAGFSLGGRFIQDKLWYYAGYDPASQDLQILKDVYTLDDEFVRTNSFIQSTDRDQFVAKLSWQPNISNSVVASVIGDPTTRKNSYYSTYYVDGPEGVPTNQLNGPEDLGGINYALNWNGIFSDKLILEAGFGHHENKDEFGPSIEYPNYQDSTPDGRYTYGVGDGSFFGGPGFQNIKDNRTRDQLRATLTWFLGDRHELKVGAQWIDNAYDINYQMVGASDSFCAPMIGMDVENPFWGPDFFGPVWINPATGLPETLQCNCDSNNDGVLDGIIMPARVGNRWRLRRTYYYNRNYKNASNGSTEEFALFLQDSWKLTDHFTVNLGIRAERSKASGDISGTVPNAELDFSMSDQIAPRVGFIWDFAGNGRSRLFGHYGKFYESIPLNINVRAMGNEVYDFYYYTYPDSDLPSAANPGQLFYWLRSGASRMDAGIKPPYMEEVVFGGDYELVRDLAVGIKGIYRSLPVAIEDISVDGGTTYFITNPGGTFTYNPGTPVPTPLDEPVTFPKPSRFYRGVELSAHKRYSNNWQGFASLLWSKLEGNYEGLYSRDNQQLDPNITSKFDLPDLLAGARGLLPNDREWQFKAYGSYRLAFGLDVGMSLQYLTGTPVNKLGAHSTYGDDERFVVPRGEGGRTPDLYTLDLHLAYPIKLGGGNLELMADVFNLFNQQRAVNVDQRWSTMDEYESAGLSVDEQKTNNNWGQPLVYYPPRNIRFGVRLSF